MSDCTCPFRATKRHEYGCEQRLDAVEGSLCNACDLPISFAEFPDGEWPDDLCHRSKSYCTNKWAQKDWRFRALLAEQVADAWLEWDAAAHAADVLPSSLSSFAPESLAAEDRAVRARETLSDVAKAYRKAKS